MHSESAQFLSMQLGIPSGPGENFAEEKLNWRYGYNKLDLATEYDSWKNLTKRSVIIESNII